tara:strand:+ start:354 stop:1079 length:726 start_codon:yes stop_codon:yes gene_type:complete
MDDVILSAFHGGLGDNLQFSTLPEEFHKQQGRDTYIWSKASFRNQEIYDLVWGCNPYIKGVKDGTWTAGDTPEIGHKTLISDCIMNWEALHGLEPTNRYPKIYYEPKKIHGFDDTLLVDLSSISITYDSEQILELYDTIKKIHNDMKFFGVEFTNKIKDATIIEPDVDNTILIEDIFTYVDLMYSSFGVVSLHSGQNHLASAIKNQYNNDLSVYCLMDDVEYVRQKTKGIFVFDNVTYLRY